MITHSGQCKEKNEEKMYRDELLRTLKTTAEHLSNIAWYFMLIFFVLIGQCGVSLYNK